MAGDDPFSLFDRMFADFNDPFGSNASRSSQPWDPFGTGFGTFGVDSSSARRGTFLDSFFGSGPSSFGGFGHDAHAQQTQHQQQQETPSSSRGVQEKRNQRSGFSNCSFSTSFGASAPSSSIGESISTSTRIVDGRREDVYKKVDSNGNSTVHIKASDGKQRVFVNGVEQAQHPLLGNSTGESAAAVRSSATHALPAASTKGDGTRSRPYEIV